MEKIRLSPNGNTITTPSGPRVTARELETGQTYLHQKLWGCRTIIALTDKEVFYLDQVGQGRCLRNHFVKVCPTLATEAEKKFLKVEAYESQWRNPPLSETHRQKAKIISIFVRNALEDFHVRHIPDAHMKEMNTTVRNAVATALHVMEHALVNKVAEKSLEWNLRCIPEYWEEPELLEGYLEAMREGEF